MKATAKPGASAPVEDEKKPTANKIVTPASKGVGNGECFHTILTKTLFQRESILESHHQQFDYQFTAVIAQLVALATWMRSFSNSCLIAQR